MREDPSAILNVGRKAATRAAGSRKRRQHPVLQGLGSAALLLVIALVIYAWPASFGGRSTIVFVSGTSMLPTLSTDDVVFAREQTRYAVGDLVVFRIPDGAIGAEVGAADGAFVIHRIVGGSESTGWVTRGDNRNSVDPWFLGEDDIVGRAERKASIGPEALTAVRLMLTPFVWAVVAAVLVFAVAWRRLSEDDADAEGAGGTTAADGLVRSATGVGQVDAGLSGQPDAAAARQSWP